MLGLVERIVEGRVVGVELGHGKLEATKDDAAVNVMEDVIPFVGLIGKAAIIVEHVASALAGLGPGRDSDRFRRVGGSRSVCECGREIRSVCGGEGMYGSRCPIRALTIS